ncbi:MAG TPA: xanthine dehydrogenase family protein subunit M [Rhizomicrobium sp.]|jgi:xanthine dehydrogenase YagS FAD-binding subunit
MRQFEYVRATDAASAVQAHRAANAAFLAGGTTLLDLMKLDVMRPQEVVDVNDLATPFGDVHANAEGLHLGAFAHMADVADNPDVKRDYPMIAQALMLAASAQIRNMATLGGNVLQRTRCSYFRDVSWTQCNKRNPGSGCAALAGNNRKHAVLGTSENCIATYAGDFAQALVALDADVEIIGPGGPRPIRFEELHVVPGSTPNIETTLQPGDLITGFFVPASAMAKRSLYLKVRDRESYEFALASAAVGLDMNGNSVNEARIALGGVATKPWRAHEAEVALKGQALDESSARATADAAFAGAVAHGDNQYKIELGKRTLVRALLQVAEA